MPRSRFQAEPAPAAARRRRCRPRPRRGARRPCGGSWFYRSRMGREARRNRRTRRRGRRGRRRADRQTPWTVPRSDEPTALGAWAVTDLRHARVRSRRSIPKVHPRTSRRATTSTIFTQGDRRHRRVVVVHQIGEDRTGSVIVPGRQQERDGDLVERDEEREQRAATTAGRIIGSVTRMKAGSVRRRAHGGSWRSDDRAVHGDHRSAGDGRATTTWPIHKPRRRSRARSGSDRTAGRWTG